jgi:hypothetical protein
MKSTDSFRLIDEITAALALGFIFFAAWLVLALERIT